MTVKVRSHVTSRYLFLTSLLMASLPIAAMGGTFTWNPGSWSALTGSGSGDSTAFIADPSSNAFFPDLTLTSNSSSQNYTLGGTYNFSVSWTPSSPTDPEPTSVTVTFNVGSTLSAFGTGVASISQGTNQINEMDASNNPFAGFTTYMYQKSVTLPIVQDVHGNYFATGSFTTDTLASTWNAGAGGATSAEESFTVYTMVGNF